MAVSRLKAVPKAIDTEMQQQGSQFCLCWPQYKSKIYMNRKATLQCSSFFKLPRFFFSGKRTPSYYIGFFLEKNGKKQWKKTNLMRKETGTEEHCMTLCYTCHQKGAVFCYQKCLREAHIFQSTANAIKGVHEKIHIMLISSCIILFSIYHICSAKFSLCRVSEQLKCLERKV